MQYAHPMQTPALKLFSDENAHMMLWRENLPAAYELLELGGFCTIMEDDAVKGIIVEAQQLSGGFDWRGNLTPALRDRLERRCASLHRHDLALLGRLFELAAGALDEALERARSDANVTEHCADLASAMRREILAHARARRETSAGTYANYLSPAGTV